MQPPISSGTVLENRYQIIQIIGQGGFGRTYLAQDQRRFNEQCAIKELIPTTTGTGSWEKAQELFRREAAILYKIDHPQIPKFREQFEQDQRLFLVQDYVAGKTYRNLLDERQAVDGAFTEAEVQRMIRSLLPVLEHIHSQGIIHRDISPDNIMIRSSDRLPVLIDFGVVKELATKLQAPNQTKNATYVGKAGYSPSEQMQSGQAYPSSDLYALAVTAVVLLTGKEPSELFDENNLTWKWQHLVTVKPGFAKIITKMLSHRPGDRIQSATEVQQALQSLDQLSPTSDTSRMQTLAVGGRPAPVPVPSPQPPRPQAPRPQPQASPPSNDTSDNPLLVVAIGAAVALLAGLGTWALVSSISSQSEPEPSASPSPTIASPVTPSPTPTSNEPIVSSKRLNFGFNQKTEVNGTIKPNETIKYTFRGQEGQQLNTLLSQENGVSLTVLNPNNEPIDNSVNVTTYSGTLPATGRYTIVLTPVPNVTQAEYTLQAQLQDPVIEPPAPSEPAITPIPEPTQEPTPEPPTDTTPTPTPKPQEPGQVNPIRKQIEDKVKERIEEKIRENLPRENTPPASDSSGSEN